jgi:hypothetical protein
MNLRKLRLFSALVVVASLSIGTLAGTAIAKPAPLSIDGSSFSPAFVSWSGVGKFSVRITNTSTSSNIPVLYVTETSGASIYDGNISFTGNAECPTPGPVMCKWPDGLRPLESVLLTVAEEAPSSGQTWAVNFAASTVGFVTGGNNSRGDAFNKSFPTTLVDPSGDRAGTYVVTAQDQLPIETGQTLSNSNTSSTNIGVPGATNIPVSIEDDLANTCPSGATACPASLFGDALELFVDNGAAHGIRLTIREYKPGRNPSQVNGIYHTWLDSLGHLQEETITQKCSATSVGQCFTASGDKNLLTLFVLLDSNGRVGGY